MKKHLFTTAALMVFAILALASCDSNKGEKLTSEIRLQLSRDLLKVCDLEITYKGKGGVDIVDTISSVSWKKTVVNDTFPSEIGFSKCRFLIKPNVKPNTVKYDLSAEWLLVTKEQKYKANGWVLDLKQVPGYKIVQFLDVSNIMMESSTAPGATSATEIVVKKAWNDSTKTYFEFENKTY